MSDELLDDVELETPSNTDTSVKDIVVEDRPDRDSPEWNDYVMSKFQDDELIEGYPIAAGLRRVAEEVLGPIAESFPVSVTLTEMINETPGAMAVWRVRFLNGQTFGDAADSNGVNTEFEFGRFAAAMASTRAEVRALRKALGLKKVAWDELTKLDAKETHRSLQRQAKYDTVTTGEEDKKDLLPTKKQINYIMSLCRKSEFNPEYVFTLVGVADLGKVNRENASALLAKLNQLRNQDNPEVPVDVRGFNQNYDLADHVECVDS